MNRKTPQVTISPMETYQVVRSQLEHEDSLTTQRLSWLLASQAFLFSAYAIVLNGPEHTLNAFVGAQRGWLLTTIPGLGLCSASLIYVSILGGILALKNIHRWYHSHVSNSPETMNLPPLQGARFTRWLGQTPPMVIPPVFAGVWLYLMLRSMER